MAPDGVLEERDRLMAETAKQAAVIKELERQLKITSATSEARKASLEEKRRQLKQLKADADNKNKITKKVVGLNIPVNADDPS